MVALMSFVTQKLLPKRNEVRLYALRFLNFISIKQWVLAAMLAEAWDELMALVRAVDVEEVGVERMGYWLLRFFQLYIGCLLPEDACGKAVMSPMCWVY